MVHRRNNRSKNHITNKNDKRKQREGEKKTIFFSRTHIKQIHTENYYMEKRNKQPNSVQMEYEQFSDLFIIYREGNIILY